MKTVKIRNIELGSGTPKVCVPIVGRNVHDILEAAFRLQSKSPDIVEWRVDFFENVNHHEAVGSVLTGLRSVLKNIPLLFTFRTSNEGGEKSITPEDYVALNTFAAKHEAVDLIDVEMFMGDETMKELVRSAHENHTFVVASNHDFHKTPSEDEIIARLRRMQDLGADIPKIAVMPQSKADVLTLLSATSRMYEEYADRPIITMSMASTGMISRLCGEVFGSALTFGAVGQTSAPGQIPANELKQILEIIHHNL